MFSLSKVVKAVVNSAYYLCRLGFLGAFRRRLRLGLCGGFCLGLQPFHFLLCGMESSVGVIVQRHYNVGVQTLSEQLDSRTLEPHYALLPVWMLHTRWKEQDFLFAMNGQTGKLIGDLPVDKGRVAAWFAGISIPLMILTALIMLL